MLRKMILSTITALMAVAMAAPVSTFADDRDDYSRDYDYTARADRYLDAEVWTDHADCEYYEGNNVRINFRVNRDAFIAIYSIDTRGRVDLLFPAVPTQDNFVYGGVTNTIPRPDDDYDLVVNGPEGMEHIQIIASRDRFPIPNWYHNSGLVFEGDDRYDYMDFLNGKYFVRYDGQRFAYDRAVIFVNEWEPYYYQPVYYPDYPSWTVAGNVYIDYPYGATVYIDGIYWGIAPLYIPRIAVGWYTVSIYDYYGYCWESDFHVSRYNSVILDNRIIKTSAVTTSKYASVRKTAYLNPVTHGYPGFKKSAVRAGKSTSVVSKSIRSSVGGAVTPGKNSNVLTRKYVRGSGKMIKTSRGYETVASDVTYSRSKTTYRSRSGSARYGKSASRTAVRGGSEKTVTRTEHNSGGYYQKKSGRTTRSYSTSRSKSSHEASRSVTKTRKTS